MRHVLWIGGPPASGKTTVATRLARRQACAGTTPTRRPGGIGIARSRREASPRFAGRRWRRSNAGTLRPRISSRCRSITSVDRWWSTTCAHRRGHRSLSPRARPSLPSRSQLGSRIESAPSGSSRAGPFSGRSSRGAVPRAVPRGCTCSSRRRSSERRMSTTCRSSSSTARAGSPRWSRPSSGTSRTRWPRARSQRRSRSDERSSGRRTRPWSLRCAGITPPLGRGRCRRGRPHLPLRMRRAVLRRGRRRPRRGR